MKRIAGFAAALLAALVVTGGGVFSACSGGSTYVVPDDGGDDATTKYEFKISELVAAITARKGSAAAENDQLAPSDFTGSNAFLTLLATKSANKYRTASKGCFEISGDALSVTFKGTGSITINFGSTGSTNTSAIALLDETNACLTASKSESATAVTADALGNKARYYAVTGTSPGSVTYTISKPGTYTITSIYYYLDNNSQPQSRGCRVHGITMTDTVE